MMYYKNNGDHCDVSRLHGRARGIHNVWLCGNFVFEVPSEVQPTRMYPLFLSLKNKQLLTAIIV